MTLERAFSIIKAAKLRGLRWSVLRTHSGEAVLGEDAEGRCYLIHPDDAVAVAEKLERDTAPPADAGDADLERAISKLWATTTGRLESEEFILADDSTTHLVKDLIGCRFTTRELDALLAAAERPGPGAAR